MRNRPLLVGSLVAVVACSSSPSSSGTDSGTGTHNEAGSPDGGSKTDAAGTDAKSAPDGQKTLDAAGDGPAPGKNTSFATALPVTVNAGAPTTGVAVDAKTNDYFSFTGKAGERVFIAANAVSLVKPPPPPTEHYIIDTVVTLYNSSHVEIAQDNDADPRVSTDSALFVDLPADGTYYFAVGDCNASFTTGCAPAAEVTDFTYQTFVTDVDMLSAPEFYANPTTQTGATTNAVPISYEVTSGTSGVVTVDGDDFTAAPMQVFSFVPPAGITVGSGRLRTELWLQPVGADNGDGSLSSVTAWITDSTGTTILAEADQSNYKDGNNPTDGPLDLSVPVTAGNTYYLFIQDDASSPAAGDYYFFVHTIEPGNPLQMTGGNNTSVATAQTLVPQGNEYLVDGDIAMPAPTQYFYEVDPPTGTSTLFARCSSLRSGSGVQGLTLDLQSQVGAGAPTSFIPSGTSVTETATADLSVPLQTASAGLAVPAGTSKVFLVVSATAQSATVVGTSYQCAVLYQ
jgi:hypothetical protein